MDKAPTCVLTDNGTSPKLAGVPIRSQRQDRLLPHPHIIHLHAAPLAESPGTRRNAHIQE